MAIAASKILVSFTETELTFSFIIKVIICLALYLLMLLFSSVSGFLLSLPEWSFVFSDFRTEQDF